MLASKQSLKILEQGEAILLATIVPVEDLDITNVTTMAREFEKSKKANATKLTLYRQLLEDEVRIPLSIDDAKSNEERQLFMLHQIYGNLPPDVINSAKSPDERFLELEALLKPSGLPRLQKDCIEPYADLKLEYVRLYQRICKRKGGIKVFRASIKAKQTVQQQPLNTAPVPIPPVVYPDPSRSDARIVTLTIGH